MAPKITIGLPVYNGERFLAEAIESVLGQTFQNLELIVSDNASTDGTQEIARRFADADPRVYFTRNPINRGAAWNYNHVVDLARGEYFKWQAHDDLTAPEYLEKGIEVLDGDNDVVLAYGRTWLIDDSGRVIEDAEDPIHLADASPSRRFAHMLRRANMCNPIMGVVRTEALRRTRRIDVFRGSDYVLLAELSMLGQLHEIHEPLFLRRMHAGSSQRANTTMRQFQQWLNPSSKSNGRFLNGRITLELVKSVWRMPLTRGEKMACLWAVHCWPQARLRDLLGRYRILLMQSLRAGAQRID